MQKQGYISLSLENSELWRYKLLFPKKMNTFVYKSGENKNGSNP